METPLQVNVRQRIESALEATIGHGEVSGAPPRLGAAIRHAVFPAGARIRPQLCLAVAAACGDGDPALSTAASVAIELLHCASLVHDDLPCFDDATMRRGVPSVHAAHGERLAVLAGDALIVLAFQALAAGATASPARLAPLIATIAAGVGVPFGIVAGQAWECETQIVLRDYQLAKTGALFAAATMAGAQAAGFDARTWRALGERLGEAYQVADDIRDVIADPDVIGKPVGRDLALGRPNVARAHGIGEAMRRFDWLMADAIEAIPACPGAGRLRALVRGEADRMMPRTRLPIVEPAAA
jgi:geranylgeranyl diphosphate synthase type II